MKKNIFQITGKKIWVTNVYFIIYKQEYYNYYL